MAYIQIMCHGLYTLLTKVRIVYGRVVSKIYVGHGSYITPQRFSRVCLISVNSDVLFNGCVAVYVICTSVWCSISSKLFSLCPMEVQWGSSLIDPVYHKRKPELTLFILDSSISSKLFSLEVQWGSSLIDLVLPQEET
jgi:hypothetical protein